MKKLMTLTAAVLTAGLTFAQEAAPAPAAQAPATPDTPATQATAPTAGEAEDTAHCWLVPSIFYEGIIETASMGRGKVFEDRPCWENVIDVRWNTDYGYFGIFHWSVLSMSDRMHEYYQHCFNEVDWGVYVGYDWQIAEGWDLDTQIQAYWMIYYGGKEPYGDEHTDFEYDVSQTLNNPYLTPYYTIRCGVQNPAGWVFATAGVKHGFAITDDLTITPSVFCEFGNHLMIEYRGGENHGNMMSLNVALRADYKITDWLSVFASVRQFHTTDESLREAYKAPHRRDITIFSAGFDLNF